MEICCQRDATRRSIESYSHSIIKKPFLSFIFNAAPTEAAFRWQMNEDAMATEKLAEGIRKFAEDTQKLQAFLRRRAGE